MFWVKALAWCQWVPGFGKRVSLWRNLQTKFWLGILLGLKCNSDIFNASCKLWKLDIWPDLTRHCRPDYVIRECGDLSYAKYWGEQLSCPLSLRAYSFNMCKSSSIPCSLLGEFSFDLVVMGLIWITALPSYTSFLFATTLTVLTFAGMQMFKTNLASSEWMTILGGFIGSQLFVFLLTVSFTFLRYFNYMIMTCVQKFSPCSFLCHIKFCSIQHRCMQFHRTKTFDVNNLRAF